jgi:hypothetical protein
MNWLISLARRGGRSAEVAHHTRRAARLVVSNCHVPISNKASGLMVLELVA